MTGLSYGEIKKILDGDAFAVGTSDDGECVIIQAELVGGDTVYTAMWESNRTERVVWYVKHWYHRDGTIEETFEHEAVTT